MPLASACNAASQSSQRAAFASCCCGAWKVDAWTGGAGRFQNAWRVDFCAGRCMVVVGWDGSASDIIGSAWGCLRWAEKSLLMVVSILSLEFRVSHKGLCRFSYHV